MVYPVTEVAAGIYQVQLPLPFALRIVNCYLLADEGGWTIIDCGLNYPDGRAGWQAACAQLGIASAAIRRILLTHAHPDHYGMAGWLAEQSGAPVWLSAIDQAFAKQVWVEGAHNDPIVAAFFERHGMDAALSAQVRADMARLRTMTAPHPALHTLEPGATMQIGARRFALLATPGHSDGHLALYCAAEHLMLCGDTVLMKITPNIGLWPHADPNPLGNFLHTLDQLEPMDVALALPGHGALITTWSQRVAEIRAHHAARLAQMEQVAGNGATAYDVCAQVFSIATLSSHQLRFAMAETLAHLEYLVSVERLRRIEGDPVLYMRR